MELKPIEPKDTTKGLDLEEVSSILEPGGPFHKSFPDYEHRSEQLEMLRASSRAISDGRHYLIEAGTGIGKSLAYLIPSALWATKNQQRVVVSTNTINLQDQLISKDIPLLLEYAGFEVQCYGVKRQFQLSLPPSPGKLAKKQAKKLRRNARFGQNPGLAGIQPDRRQR